MTWAQVCDRRLARHALDRPAPDPVAVAARVCGVHAQVMSTAEVAIGIRTAGVTRVDVRAALWQERSLVKTYGPRGTVHLVPASELALWCAALSAAPWPRSGQPPAIRLSPEQTEAVLDAIGAALREGDRTADELDEWIGRAAGTWAVQPVLPAFAGLWPRWRQAIATAAYRGVLCFGPARGRRVTYTAPARWLAGAPGTAGPPAAPDTAGGGASAVAASGPAALAEVTLRFLDTYGPATPQQFGQWLGVPGPAARDLFGSLVDRLCEVDMDGTVAYLPAGDTSQAAGGSAAAGGPARAAGPAGPARRVRLLPYFDPYTVGCHPRSALFPGPAAQRALSGGQAGTVPVLLRDGVVAGVWQQRRAGHSIEVTVEPFVALGAGQRRELDAEVARLGEIQQAQPTLTLGTVTARGHL